MSFRLFVTGILWTINIYASHPADENKSFPQFSDLVYEYHLEELNKHTPFELTFNQYVKRYIDIFTIERREQVNEFIGLSEIYFPIFEDYFQKYDLPMELKYLAVVESGLDPLARSSSNAIGLWQFLFHSAQMFDLKITSYIDERNDVYKSTDAACRYLKYLFQTFGNWELALAAYNGGPGELNKAIARSGGKTNFWDLYPYLTDAMKNYVPAFIAMNYVFNYYEDHKLKPKKASWSFHDLDTLQLDYKVSFESICKKLGMEKNELKKLNPCYKLDIIPESDQSMILVLPKDKALIFLQSENSIISAKNNTKIKPENRPGMKQIYYAVRKGDYLHKIAIRYGCTVDDICRWNKMNNRNISVGTRLIIWTINKDI